MMSFGKTILAGLAVAALADTSSFGVSARRVRMQKKLGTVVKFDGVEGVLSGRGTGRGKDGDGGAGGGDGGMVMCCTCVSLIPFIFLIMWQISALWGPSAGSGMYEIFFKCDTDAYSAPAGLTYKCEDGNPWQIYQDASGNPTGLQALPWTCKEYANKPIFGALTPQDEHEHGARMQEILKISLLYYAAGTTIMKVLYACCGLENREEKKPNCFGKLLVNGHLLTVVGLWMVQCISLDYNRKHDEVCDMMTRWVDPVSIIKSNATVPTVLVEDTHMHDLAMTSTVLGGVTVAMLIMHFLQKILCGDN